MRDGPLERILAVRLRELVHLRKLGITTLSQRTSMSETTLRRLLAGRGSPTLRTLQRVARALGVEPVLTLHDPRAAAKEDPHG
jgi:DNA-binding phage protein